MEKKNNASLPTLSGKPLLPVKSGQKRPNENGLSSADEPDVQKKPKLTPEERKHLFEDIFKGKSNEVRSDEEDGGCYDDDSFIDDDSDPDEEARNELEKMMGMYRQKVQKRRGWEEGSSDKKSGSDDLQAKSRDKESNEEKAEFDDLNLEDDYALFKKNQAEQMNNAKELLADSDEENDLDDKEDATKELEQ